MPTWNGYVWVADGSGEWDYGSYRTPEPQQQEPEQAQAEWPAGLNLTDEASRWQAQRAANGENPTDSEAFRRHVEAVYGVDPGGLASGGVLNLYGPPGSESQGYTPPGQATTQYAGPLDRTDGPGSESKGPSESPPRVTAPNEAPNTPTQSEWLDKAVAWVKANPVPAAIAALILLRR